MSLIGVTQGGWRGPVRPREQADVELSTFQPERDVFAQIRRFQVEPQLGRRAAG